MKLTRLDREESKSRSPPANRRHSSTWFRRGRDLQSRGVNRRISTLGLLVDDGAPLVAKQLCGETHTSGHWRSADEEPTKRSTAPVGCPPSHEETTQGRLCSPRSPLTHPLNPLHHDHCRRNVVKPTFGNRDLCHWHQVVSPKQRHRSCASR